jgi:hypothetical protein
MTKMTRVLMSAAVLAGSACGGGGRDRAGTETGAVDTTAADTAPAPPSNELAISGVMIGKRIGQNNLITEPTFQFGPKDTVYVSVGTTGAPDSANLTAVWHFQGGKRIDSTSQTIKPEGPANTEFHLVNAKGFPVGTYLVTIYADGDSADARTFAVKKQ